MIENSGRSTTAISRLANNLTRRLRRSDLFPTCSELFSQVRGTFRPFREKLFGTGQKGCDLHKRGFSAATCSPAETQNLPVPNRWEQVGNCDLFAQFRGYATCSEQVGTGLHRQ